MISQLLAIHHPDRVASLTSVMSSPNSRLLPPPKISALKALVGPRVRIQNVDQYVEFGKKMLTILGGVLPRDDDDIEALFRQTWERGLHPRGVHQQFMAIMATGSFRKYLSRIKAPTTVIHGESDPLIRPAGGRLSARMIPGARLHLIKGMGHDLPAKVLPEIAESIIETTRRARRPDAVPSVA